MRAVIITKSGGPEVLKLVDRPAPTPGPGQVRVRVQAAGLNRADILQRRGFYPAPSGAPPDIPGLEYAGEVDEVGPGVSLRNVGERVMGIVGGGACAEHLVVHERETIAIPDDIDTTDAAAIPEVFLTAFDALQRQAKLQPGHQVLIHAVGSGVGTAALQLVKLAGGIAFGTTRSAWKLERCLDLDLPINTSYTPDFDSQVQKRGGADIVLDLVGAAYFERNLRALKPSGHIIIVGLLGGVNATIPLNLVLQRRISITGTALRSRPIEEKITLARLFEHRLSQHFSQKSLKPVVDRTFSMDDIQLAHTFMQENANFGKILLTW